MSEVVQQRVYVTQGDKIVQKNVLDLTPEESQKISEAIHTFLSVTKQLNPDFNDEDLQAIIERCDASGRPSDDVMSYTFARNEMRRETRRRAEDEIKAREQASQSVAREAQLRAEREEYLRPSNRAEVARQPQQNQPQATPAPPARQWTNGEIDRMSADDMARVGLVTRATKIEDRQGNSTSSFMQPERPGKRQGRKIKFSQEELASQEYRKRVIAHDEAERRKLKEDLQRALEAQEEKKWNERKRRS